MRILQLTIENFQGIRSLSLTLEGKNAAIYGDNATGKTTVYNAITWLLFDKASTGAKGFTPKTRDKDGEAHNLEHSAEALLETESGEKIRLKKVFHEVYKKKHGSASEEFSGHTVDYFVDSVPVKEREYSDRVSRICGGISTPQMLTSPDFFPSLLPWAERRALLVSICGDVADEDILTSSDDMKELSELLKIEGTERRHTVEEFKKIAAARKTEINRQLATIPARIDEASKAIPELTEISVDAISEKIGNLDKLINDLTAKRTDAAYKGTELARLEELNTQKEQARAEYFRKYSEANAAITAELTAAQAESRDAVIQISRAKNELTEKENERGRMERARAELLKEYSEAAAMRFPSDAENCPTCHRRLPEEKVDELRSGFVKRKKARLDEINARGQEVSKERIDGIVAEIKAIRGTVSELEAKYLAKNERVTALNAKIAVVVPFEQTERARELNRLIEEENARVMEASERSAAVLEHIDHEIAELKAAKVAEEEKIARIRLAQTQRARIAELEAEEKRLGAEFTDIERVIWLCDEFTRAKVSALDSRINSRFETVRFRLFEEQINGGLKDCCDVMIPRADGVLVPYAFANTAAQINAGLEIISALSHHFGVSLPVVVDNAESVTALREIPAQVVRLVVSENDKSLKLETYV